MKIRAALLLMIFPLIAPASGWAQRERLSMDPGWRFTRGDPAGAQVPDFDDSSWSRLDLPHDWSVDGRPEEDAPGGGRVGYFPTGVGWYRKWFRAPQGTQGREVWLEFDGVYMNSEVWINGQRLGKRPYGYIGFAYDVTRYLRTGENVVAVRVDNSVQPNTRYYSGSGINRHTWLSIIDSLHVGRHGTVVSTARADSASAVLVLATRVENDGAAHRRGTLRTLLLDPSGREVSRTDAPFRLGAGLDSLLRQEIPVPNPQLWSPHSPSLYKLRQMVLVGQHAVDASETRIGIRTASFDRDRGFLLNGERVKLNGVNVHEDAGSVGTAVPERMWERRLEVLKAMGVNAIRTAHNPFAPEFLDLADRMGFLVMDEAFDEWTVGKVEEGYHRYFEEWSERDLTEFVRRDRNHPSVVLWSAGNEIGEQSRPDGHEVLSRLMAIIHREDPTRPVTTGNDQIAADGHPATEHFLNQLDIVGYNYVDRWHERRELYAEEDRHRHPEWKMIGTESSSARGPLAGDYSLGGDSARVQPNYTTGMIRAEELWKWVATHDYFAGDFMWTGIDYLGETRWPSKGAGAGAIDIIGFPKDAFYLYQSQWTSAPVLHLFPHWNWPGREGQLVPVLAYTNCTAVELFLNGRSMGEKRLEFPMQGTSGGWNSYARPQVNPTTTNLHLTWDVPYEPGVLRAVGKDGSGARCEAKARTAGPPTAIRLSVDRDTIAADPRDVAHVTFEIVDADGTVVPDAVNRVHFTIEGGKILALDNADLRDREPNRSTEHRAFAGRGLAVVQAERAGRIRLSASSDGIRSAMLEIVAVAGDLLPTIPSSRP